MRSPSRAKPLIDPDKLDFAIANGFNVLLTGRHGVGKTVVIKSAFERAELKLRYFSAPTMDPWVDLVGIPKPVEREGKNAVLELVRPPEFEDDEVDAIFLDEFNRAPKKVRNAAMELIQFQSINGRRFKRLRMVWAAINPADDADKYDVEPLDPAQLDRFHLHLDIPYRPCPAYFIKNYGEVGKAALEWWDGLGPGIKAKVSPRRLETAIRVHAAGGSLRDVLPDESSPKRLVGMFESGPMFERLRGLMRTSNHEEATRLLHDPEWGSMALHQIVRMRAAIVFFLPLVDVERRAALLDNQLVLETVIQYARRIPEFAEALSALILKGNKAAYQKASEIARRHNLDLDQVAQPSLLHASQPLTEEEVADLDPYGRVS